MTSPNPSVAVVGAGAVGCYFGGMLARAGVPVTLIGRRQHVDAIVRNGLQLHGLRVNERVPVRASTELSAACGADLVLFCVKTIDNEETARALQPLLAPSAHLISMQNGVDNVERIQAASGIRAIAAVVYVAAAMTAPGEVTHSGRGDLIVEPRAEPFRDLFERSEIPCHIAEDIRTDLWTKMLMNCACNAISALGQVRYGDMVADPGARELIRRLMEEAVAVAQLEGVTLDAAAMTEAAYNLGAVMSNATSSTAQDLERGKRTEIDSLNGYLMRRASQDRMPVPANQALHALVKLRERFVSVGSAS
jgi:2-dehydropantoate 2-reductase